MGKLKKIFSMFLGASIGLAIFFFGVSFIYSILENYFKTGVIYSGNFADILFIIEVFLLLLGLIIGAVFLTKPIEYLIGLIFKEVSEQNGIILRNITQEPVKTMKFLIFLVVSFFIGTISGSLIAYLIFLFLWFTPIGNSILHSVTPPSDYEGYAGLIFLLFSMGCGLFAGFAIAFILSFNILKSKLMKVSF